MKFYVHDFYAQCPRVTMLNAVGRFCEVRMSMGGRHEVSRMDEMTPAEYRKLFALLLALCGGDRAIHRHGGLGASRVPGPGDHSGSASAGRNGVPDTVRDGEPNQIALLGAIGPHKRSRKLLELAREACLVDPELLFHVIGYTDIDRELRAVGNVTVTGPYEREEIPVLVDQAQARVALFQHE